MRVSASKKDQIRKHLKDARELASELDDLPGADRARVEAGIDTASAALASVFPEEPEVHHRGPEDEPDAESKVGARRASRSRPSGGSRKS
jgi:hypothetical protein